MPTIVTLDPAPEAQLRAATRAQGIGFKEALHQPARAGLGPRSRTRIHQRTFRIGLRPAVPHDRALQLAAAAEDQEFLGALAPAC